MPNAPSFARIARTLLCCALATLVSTAASAQSIDVSLNVLYADPQNTNSGGTWEVIAKSSDFGIQALSLRITGITPVVQFDAPIGEVNTGSDDAGFSILVNSPQTGHRNLSIAQEPIDPFLLGPGEEQGLFYGVGTIANGNPGDVGPAFTTLANVQNVPWATGDVFGDTAWDTAAMFASGAFATGVTPGFFAGTNGQVFTTLGTSTDAGAISLATISTIVRTNSEVLPDYNMNGVVDAADYVLWRKDPASYGGDPAGYIAWRDNFGAIVGPGAGAGLATIAVPEPAASILLGLGAALAVARRRRLRARRKQASPSALGPSLSAARTRYFFARRR